jgi:predicted PurR-regulated permease PerM
MSDQLTDHDVLTTLVANVTNLAKSQDEFRKEMKESIDDLKNNYSSRIQGIEDFKNNADKVFAAKHDQDGVNDDLYKQVNSLKQWRSYTAGALAIVTIIVLPIMAWLAVSVVNHIADDKANQVTVQQIQNTYNGLNQTLSTLQTEIQNHINQSK